MNRKTKSSVLAGIGFCFSLVVAQPEIERLYEGGFYDQVIEKADSILQQKLTAPELKVLHTWKAFAYVALEEKEKAKEEFKIVLLLDPNLKLNPGLVSPKIIEVFEQAKDEIKSTAPRIVPAPIPKRNLSFLLFPGINQLSAGQKTKGYLLLSSEILAISGLALTHAFTLSAHTAYRKARDPDDIEKKYGSYKNWFALRSGFAGCTIGIYLVSIFDGLLRKPVIAKTGFYLQPSFSGFAGGYCW